MSPISTAADFAEPETKIIDLPRQHNGKPLSMKIRAVPTVQLVQALEGIPALSRAQGKDAEGTTFEQARSLIIEQDRPSRRVAKLGVVEPKLCVEGEPAPDEGLWDNLNFKNQKFIVEQIMDFSGLSSGSAAPAPGGEAEAASFR